MVGNDLELEFEELVLPFHQDFDYCECLIFECPIVLLSITQLLGHKPYGVACPPVISLPIQYTNLI